MTAEPQQQPHWLDQYASNCYIWKKDTVDGVTTFYRPLGLVESCFDADGRYYEGRADISLRLDLSVTTTYTRQARHDHVILAWACLRHRHILAKAKAPAWQSWMTKPDAVSYEYCFQVDVPSNVETAIAEARDSVTFLEDHHDLVSAAEFYSQSQNCARVLDTEKALARLFVLPPIERAGQQSLQCIFVAAHQIGDGLSTGRWLPDFTRLLNLDEGALEAELATLIKSDSIERILPLAQEALYPRISGSRARQRWYWVITRILRHVRKPLPAGFANPLLKATPERQTVPHRFSDVLRYDKTPPTQSAPCRTRTSAAAMKHLQSICRQAGVSIGAGCFALAAVLMMEFYERREPDTPLHERKPFITGFPLNPRPFLTGNPSADSLMLAFSDGILLPFLPSSLGLEGRLRLLARAAQRQLAIYQKRTSVVPNTEGIQYMSSRGAGRVLSIQYLSSFERCQMLHPEQNQQKANPQGGYPMRPNMTRQTCGVSSLGRRSDLNALAKHLNHDFKATAIDKQPSVRARDGEFLIAIDGTENGLAASISVDDISVDPALVEAWLYRFEHILDLETVARL